MSPRGLLLRAAALFLACLFLLGVFADLLASEAPLLMRHDGKLLVLPAISARGLVAGKSAAELTADPAVEPLVWAPVPAMRCGDPGAGVGCTIRGSREVVLAVLLIVIGSLVVGIPVGMANARGEGWLSRALDMVGGLPTVVLAALVMASWPQTQIWGLWLVLLLSRALEVARLVRIEFLRLLQTPFVESARALGLTPLRVLARHVMPNAAGPILVSAALSGAWAVGMEAALGYLELAPSSAPSWGTEIGRSARTGSGLPLGPMLGVLLTVLSMVVVAEAMDARFAARRRESL